MRLLICCDATAEGGLGHFFRSVAIAEEALSRGFAVSIAGAVDVPLAVDTCNGLGLPAIPTDLGDGASIVAAARSVDADVLHVDSYVAPQDLRELLADSGILLSSMEDGAFGRRASDVAIDPSPDAELHYRSSDGSCRHLRGLAFAPMRNSIRMSRGWSGRNDPSRLLVMMGGTDPLGVSDRICSELRAAFPDADLHVIRPSSASAAVVAGVSVHTPSEQITSLLEDSDVVVAGAGTTVWELCHLGVPMAIVRLVDNQSANFRYATERGVALPLAMVDAHGRLSSSAIDELGSLLLDESALHAMSERGKRLVDGSGVLRIVDSWVEAVARRDGLVLRPADDGDASQLFDWRNEAAVRAVSGTTEALDWAEHRKWFSRTLDDPDTESFIADVDSRPAGQVRFDRRHRGCWRVSIVVDPAFRHRGMGAAVLREGETSLRAAHGPVVIEATVASTNQPSIRLFETAGYRRGASDGTSAWTAFEKTVP